MSIRANMGSNAGPGLAERVEQLHTLMRAVFLSVHACREVQ